MSQLTSHCFPKGRRTDLRRIASFTGFLAFAALLVLAGGLVCTSEAQTAPIRLRVKTERSTLKVGEATKILVEFLGSSYELVANDQERVVSLRVVTLGAKRAKTRVPVKVLLHYAVGNHDWFFHLPGTAFNDIRKTIVTAVGLANPADVPFPHDPFESEELKQTYRDHRVFARHGDIFDSFNYDHDRNISSLGDTIVVELLNKFPEEVQKRLGDELPKECALGLREIDNVRPLMIVPVWINGLLRRTCPDAIAKKIKSVWDELVDQFLALSFVQQHHSVTQLFDDVSKLEWALKFSKGVSLGNLSNIVAWCKERLGIREGAFYPHAFAETEFKNLSWLSVKWRGDVLR